MTDSIVVNALSKRYRKGRGLSSLRELLGARSKSEAATYHWAVRDVSFAVQPGESLGIIGPNGAGKTTILKLLSHVTLPTSGTVQVDGRFSALIELGAGFHPDLTGRENIYLNGAILGMKRAEINDRFRRIVDFAEIGDYLDTPVKRYSSGMYARLGFAIAAHVDPDVLLVDEVLAVGDTAFQARCYQRMQTLQDNGTALVFVSHNMQVVQRVCSRAMVLVRGEKQFEGPAAAAVAEYFRAVRGAAAVGARPTGPEAGGLQQLAMTHEAQILGVDVRSTSGSPLQVVPTGDTFEIAMRVGFREEAPQPIFACTIYNERGDLIYDTTTQWQQQTTPDFGAGDEATVVFRIQANLLAGMYTVKVDLAYADLSCYYDYLPNAATFVVDGRQGAKGESNLFAEIEIEHLPAGQTGPESIN